MVNIIYKIVSDDRILPKITPVDINATTTHLLDANAVQTSNTLKPNMRKDTL